MSHAVAALRADRDEPLSALAVVDAPGRPVGEGEVEITLEAAALNHHDLWTLRGVGAVPLEYPRVMGSDGAGGGSVVWPLLPCGDVQTCWGCGNGAPQLCRRLTMIGEGRDGTLAPAVVVPEGHIVPAPANLTAAEAACLPSAYLTAYSMIFRAANAQPGETVLVTGATGGMGVAALQLGAAAGMRMVAQVRRTAIAPALEALGASAVVGTDEDVKTRVGGEVDVVLESVGRATWATSLRALRPGGTVVVSGASSGDDPPAGLRRIFWRQLRVIGCSLGSLDDLAALCRFVEERDLHPAIAATHPINEAAEAFAQLAAGEVLGKIVLIPD